MRSVTDAMEKVVSKKLKGNEQKVLDLMVQFTDMRIDAFFDGVKVAVPVGTDGKVPTSDGKLQYISLSNAGPVWRQKVVLDIYKEEYEKLGWRVQEIEVNGMRNGNYVFTADPSWKRDETLKSLLDEK